MLIFWGQKSLNEWHHLFKNVFMHVFGGPKNFALCTNSFFVTGQGVGECWQKSGVYPSSEWTKLLQRDVCTAAAVRTCSRLTSKVAPVRKVMGKQKPSGSTLSAWRSLPLSLNHNNSHLHHHHHHLHLHHPIWTLHALLMQKCMPVGAFHCLFTHSHSLCYIFKNSIGFSWQSLINSNVIFFCLSATLLHIPAACLLCSIVILTLTNVHTHLFFLF